MEVAARETIPALVAAAPPERASRRLSIATPAPGHGTI
jgi:hypothetical protein